MRQRFARGKAAAVVAAAFAAALCALVAAPGALAHGGAASELYLSEVTSIAPAIPGLTAVVLGRDDQIEVDNAQAASFTVLGYEDEPYLRFGPDGVEVNLHSPAYYLNQDRYAKVALPKDADARLAPKWNTVTQGRRWSWHDHRIHWMSTILPPDAKADPRSSHLVFDWKLPLRLAGAGDAGTAATVAAISGRLTYVPPKGGTDTGLIIGIALPVGVVLLAGGATGFLVLRRRRLVAAAAAEIAAGRAPER